MLQYFHIFSLAIAGSRFQLLEQRLINNMRVCWCVGTLLNLPQPESQSALGPACRGSELQSISLLDGRDGSNRLEACGAPSDERGELSVNVKRGKTPTRLSGRNTRTYLVHMWIKVRSCASGSSPRPLDSRTAFFFFATVRPKVYFSCGSADLH